MPTKLMTVREWIAVPDNPIQRDTERHAQKAKHLHTPKPTHWIVFACEFPDGKIVKLDGHTRALLWKRNEIPQPRSGHVECHLVPVKNEAEAMDLYRTFDSKEALETVADKVSGAFGHLKFHPDSVLLQRGGISSALKGVWNVYCGRAMSSHEQKRDSNGKIKKVPFDIYAAIDEFATELFALDSYNLKPGECASGVLAAFILTYRRHGMKVVPFWTAVFGNGGERSHGKMDGVQAVVELILGTTRRGRGTNWNTINDLCARCVMACEKWLENEYFIQVPRPYDLTGYIAGLEAKVTLIKKEQRK